MHPYEEAKELLECFYSETEDYHIAKQCALICVNEMIEQVKKFKFIIHHEYEIMHLNRVKKEIENYGR